MPYNGSGVFTLYTPGNPVVTGTTISSTWANSTLQDIANNGLSGVITKDGQTTVTADIPLSGFRLTNAGITAINGSAATPAINVGDATSGLYRPSQYQLGFSYNGSSAGTLTASGWTEMTFVAPVLGTPTSGTLTNCTGLPMTTGVTGTLGVANGGTGLTSLSANRIPVGNGTGDYLSYATLSFNGTTFEAPQIKPASTAGIVGTTTNDNADAGSFGEYITASVASGSAVSLTSITAKTVTSISLTAGDWDVTGLVAFTTGASTNVLSLVFGASTTNNTLGADGTYGTILTGTAGIVYGAATNRQSIPIQRISIAGTTTVYLIAFANFSADTCSAYGTIRARRVR